MSGLTVIVILGWVIALIRRDPLIAVGIGGVTPAGAFLTLGGIALPTVYASVLFAIVATLLFRGRDRPTAPPSHAITGLWIFALLSIIVTVSAPFLFEGVTVVTLGTAPRELSPVTFLTSSNIAQMLYLVLGVATAALAARRPDRAVRAIWIALAGAALLSLWRFAGLNLGLPFPFQFFDNSSGFRYIDGAPGGVVRFRGILSEPAALAASSLACIAIGLALIGRTVGVRRVGVIAVVVVAVFNLSQSTSATGVLAAAALIVIVALSSVGGLVLQGRRWSAKLTTAVLVVAVAAIWVLPVAAQLVSDTIDAKVGTSSYDERSGTDLYSFGLVLQTFGVGVGVGSNRPSSFLAALFASTGVIGGTLFLGVLLWSGVRATRDLDIRPALWALLAIMIAKFVASPDLSDTSGTLWLSIGAVIGARPPATLEPSVRHLGRHRGTWVGNRRVPLDTPAPSS